MHRRFAPLAAVAALLFALAAVLLVSSPAHAAPVDAVIDGVHYEADDANVAAGATVVGHEATISGPLTIPASVTIGSNNYAVTHIDGNAFNSAPALGAVSIPDTVISIGVGAFQNTAMTSLDLGHGVKTIGNYAFYGTSFDAIVLPDSVVSIGAYAFYDVGATTLDLGQGIQDIGAAAFFSNAFTSVEIPASVTAIGDWAFDDIPTLTSVMFWGPAPTISAATADGSFGADDPARPLGFLAANGEPATPGGFTTPTWQGYTTKSFDVPGPPTNVVGTAGNTEVALVWTAPADDGGSPVTEYLVEYSSNGGTTWITGPSAIGTMVTVNGLVNGVGYQFRVYALNADGASAPSAASLQVVPQGDGGLPPTGSETTAIFAIGLASLLIGAGLVRLRRPRHA